jgi:hypothetical protein
MAAGALDLTCEQGTTFKRTITLYQDTAKAVPVDLTGFTFRGQIRSSAKATGAPTAAFLCAITNATGGAFSISLTAEQTSAIPTIGESYSVMKAYVYDLEMVAGDGTVSRLLNGAFNVSPEVTK